MPRRDGGHAGALRAVAARSGCGALHPSSAPILYHTPQYQSPVRGEPGDVLLLPGAQFWPQAVVVYAAVRNTTQPPLPPAAVPTGQTEQQGRIVPLAVDDDCNKNALPPDVLAPAVKVVRPRVMKAGQSYALWVANHDPGSGQYHFSNGILINDARPMWISPGPLAGQDPPSYPYVYSTALRPGLPRALKIIGRNLQPPPVPRAQTQVHLVHPSLPSITLPAANDDNPATQIEHYVAHVTLPDRIPPGTYYVTVSRDGESWVPVAPGPTFLTVLPDPIPRKTFHVSDFGDATHPCTGQETGGDDTFCITRALYAAQLQGGGDVVFPPGTWRVSGACWSPAKDTYSFQFPIPPGSPPYVPCSPLSSRAGIAVPPGVNLVALRPGVTIQTDAGFGQPWITYAQAQHQPQPLPPTADPGTRQNVFLLAGNNLVQGLRFHDTGQQTYANTVPPGRLVPGAGALLLAGSNVTITDNSFDDTYYGVVAADLGYADVVITGNRFGVYWEPIYISGALEDSIIARNTFWPGAVIDTLALGVAGSRHLDVSANTVDGIDTTYSQGLVGWRAGFFFPHRTSHEQLLVAGNTFTCVGTRHGQDGEAISMDANKDRLGFRSGQGVTSVLPSGDRVTVTPAPGEALLSVDQGDYLGRWLRVDAGPGLGQARKITGAVQAGGAIQFAVSPPFDVLLVAGHSRILVSQQSWQLYVVDNVVDNGHLINNGHTHTCAELLANVWTEWALASRSLRIRSGTRHSSTSRAALVAVAATPPIPRQWPSVSVGRGRPNR